MLKTGDASIMITAFTATGITLMDRGISHLISNRFPRISKIRGSSRTSKSLSSSGESQRAARDYPQQARLGDSAMPIWEDSLTKDEIWDVILFLSEYTGYQPRTFGEGALKMKTRHVTLLMLVLGIVGGALCWVSVTYAQNAPEASEKGKVVYEQSCAHCHGTEGRGDGSAAENLLPKPRDFTRGLYKIRSTESGQLPTDQDLFDIITIGMPGSSMPGWETSLSADERWEVVAYIKTFYDGFKESEAPPREISLEGKIPYSEQSVETGKELYVELGCVECHGNVGRGDGTSAPTLTDEWGFQTWPANLAQSWNFRGGADTEAIFKRFIGGIAGSPMPRI